LEHSEERRNRLTENNRLSIVIPAYNEDGTIINYLTRLVEAVETPFECFIVVDTEKDLTINAVKEFIENNSRFQVSINQDGPGPAMAIRHGFKVAKSPVVVVTMADGSDDPKDIDTLVRLVERGVKVAAASRYMAGGQQIGAPLFKSFLSRTAGKSLHVLARVGTHDATNSFKAYDRKFVESVGIQSIHGFEIGIELVAKAKRLNQPIAEIPTIWIERDSGESKFNIKKWLPKYWTWYRFCFGRSLSLDELRNKFAN
jgi:glycosyltransferase involved in cell wall biosynthesis